MNWISIDSEKIIEDIIGRSEGGPVLVFKHSTRCPISSMALSRLERSNDKQEIPCFFLDLIRYRDLSNKIAEQFVVEHQSPQVLLIKDGMCFYDDSHSGVTWENINSAINS